MAIVLAMACTAFSLQAQQTGASTNSPQAAVDQIPRPNHPITKEQLQEWMEASLALDANKQFLHAGLEGQRKTLPPWFPSTVWDDVEGKIESIDTVALLLPLYQRYVSEDAATAMIFLYQGSTGEALAKARLQARLDAFHGGNESLEGRDKALLNGDSQSDPKILFQKRVAEFTPEQRALMLQSIQGIENFWIYIDKEANPLLQAKANEVMQSTLAAHDDELRHAQQMYMQSHPEAHP
jgi:hypothetical protein